MSLNEFAALVAELRHAQKTYFRTRERADLERSKALERKVDKALDELSGQKTLFPLE